MLDLLARAEHAGRTRLGLGAEDVSQAPRVEARVLGGPWFVLAARNPAQLLSALLSDSGTPPTSRTRSRCCPGCSRSPRRTAPSASRRAPCPTAARRPRTWRCTSRWRPRSTPPTWSATRSARCGHLSLCLFYAPRCDRVGFAPTPFGVCTHRLPSHGQTPTARQAKRQKLKDSSATAYIGAAPLEGAEGSAAAGGEAANSGSEVVTTSEGGGKDVRFCRGIWVAPFMRVRRDPRWPCRARIDSLPAPPPPPPPLSTGAARAARRALRRGALKVRGARAVFGGERDLKCTAARHLAIVHRLTAPRIESDGRWSAPEILDDYKSAAAGGKRVQATRRTRFATFPPYLTVVIKRCVWAGRKPTRQGLGD